MLTAEQVLTQYYLDTRCALIEIAAMLDRHDRASREAPGANGSTLGDTDGRLAQLQAALAILAQTDHEEPNRSEQLLLLFSDLS